MVKSEESKSADKPKSKAEEQKEEVTNKEEKVAAGTEKSAEAAETKKDAGMVEAKKAEFQDLSQTPKGDGNELKLNLLLDLDLPVSIELGRTSLQVRDILNLQRGSVIEFDKLASEPVDILINGRKMAEGEVVVIEKHFGIRITHLISKSDRLKELGKE